MPTIREFVHDGSHFTITSELDGDVWTFKVLCDGKGIGQLSSVSDEVMKDATTYGVDLKSAVADELQRAVQCVHDLTVKKYR